jgi:copper chaperone CopZ
MEERKVTVPAINCGHCTKTIETELSELAGVQAVSASIATKEVTVRFGPPASWTEIEALLQEIGFPPGEG